MCVTVVRDPFARAVSAWFYTCHNPSFDCYGVGWPPAAGFLQRRRLDVPGTHHLDGGSTKVWRAKDGSRRTATFDDFSRARAYSQIFVRMFGANAQAYHGAATTDAAALDRAVAVLRATPFALLEDMPRSYALLAHAFSKTSADCAALASRLAPLADRGTRRSARPMQRQHAVLASNETLRAAFERRNALDRAFYRAAVDAWCAEWRRAAADPTSCVGRGGPDPPVCAAAAA